MFYRIQFQWTLNNGFESRNSKCKGKNVVGISVESKPLNLEVAQALSKKIKVDNRLEKLPIQLKFVEGEDWVTMQPQSLPSKKLQVKEGEVGLKKSPMKLGVNDGGIFQLLVR